MTSNPQVVATGNLPKGGTPYHVLLLGVCDSTQLAALQQEVHDALTEEEKPYLITRDAAYYESLLHTGSAAFGIEVQGRVVAQSLLVLPTESFPYTGMTDIHFNMPLSALGVLCGTVVHPHFRGNNLQNILTQARMALAGERGRSHVFTEIAVKNITSWHNLMREDLTIHSIGLDPADNTVLYNLHRDMLKPAGYLKLAFNHASIPCPKEDLATQKALLCQGYKGIDFHPATGHIIFGK